MLYKLRMKQYALIHFLSAKIYFLWLVVAESLMLRRKQIVVEYKEVRILAGFNGSLFFYGQMTLFPLSAGGMAPLPR